MKPKNRLSQTTLQQSDATGLKRYRLRSEVVQDISKLIDELGPAFVRCAIERVRCTLPGGHTMKPGDTEALIDVEGLSLDEMRDVIRRVEDGHVMLQTIQTPGKYTGERDCELE